MPNQDNWILVPCHNNADLLIQSLSTLLGQKVDRIRLFLLNNGSTDNVPFVLAGLGAEHVVVNSYPQLGVAGGWNFGLRYLFGVEKAERVLVVNQDVELHPETYRVLLQERGLFCTAVSVNKRDGLSAYAGEGGGKRPHPDFSCYLIDRRCYDLVGGFDEGFYPAWFEDNDYHIRMAQAGVEAYCISIPFFHYAAATMKRASEYDKAHIYNQGFLASQKRFYNKYGVLPGTKEYEALCTPSNSALIQ